MFFKIHINNIKVSFRRTPLGKTAQKYIDNLVDGRKLMARLTNVHANELLLAQREKEKNEIVAKNRKVQAKIIKDLSNAEMENTKVTNEL